MRQYALTCMLLLTASPALAVTKTGRGFVEVAPLRGLVGQVATRAEGMLTPVVGVGGGYETVETPAERIGARDVSRTYYLEGVWYAHRIGQHAFFGAIGLKQEDSVLHREVRRDDRTGQTRRADQMYDVWTNYDQTWSSTQTIGYRLVDGWWTASLRWTRDESLYATQRSRVDSLQSDDPDLSSARRPAVRQSIALHAGLALP